MNRRLFLRGTLVSGTAVVATTSLPLAVFEVSVAARSGAPEVIAFFDGQLWLDTTGTSTPYRAPAGARGAACAEMLADDALCSLYGRL
jgi:hypothetical protein